MSDDLAILYQVQQIDGELARHNDELRGLDTGEALQAEIEAAETEMKDLQAQHRSAEQESMDCNLELSTLEEKKAKFEAQLYGGAVRNPRQLTDLQGETQMLSREIRKIEDRILDVMEAMERQRAELGQSEQALSEMKRRLAEVRDSHESASHRLRGEIAELESRRKELASQVSPTLLKRYEQIRARQGNLALVRVADGNCPGCRISFPSETVKRLKAGGSTQTCENCGRLLYFDRSGS